jgi:hypothetical protein
MQETAGNCLGPRSGGTFAPLTVELRWLSVGDSIDWVAVMYQAWKTLTDSCGWS